MNTEQTQKDGKSAEQWSSKPLYLGPGAQIEGDVQFGDGVSVWHNAVLRTESEPIRIGTGSNVQDLCVLHTDPGHPVEIGQHVTLGHGAIVHGAAIEDDCLIGMGAIIMNGARIGKGSIIAAGALIPEGKQIEAGSLAMGVPARTVRTLSDEEIAASRRNALHYVREAEKRIRTASGQKD